LANEKKNKRQFGDSAEKLAAEYLESRGFKIAAANWRESRFELDIVAVRDELMAFVEVKASRRKSHIPPELRVGRIKQKRIIEAASEYISRMDETPEEIRFDVIGIVWSETGEIAINHIESAFTAD